MSGLRAIVLVGGEGTRLRPLTLTRPKPMLPVIGVSILEHKLAHLAKAGVTHAVLSLGYKPDFFISAFPSGTAAGVQLSYAIEPSPLDTAGAIRFAADAAGFVGDYEGGPIIVVNGDVLTSLDLSRQLEFHRTSGAQATIALTRVEDPSAFGVVPIDDEGRVIAFVEKPKKEEAPTDWINAGCYILEPGVLDLIPAGEKTSIERITFPILVENKSLFAVQHDEYWLDAGTPATYLQASLDILGDDSHIDATSSVDATASVRSSVIDASCVVGAGATIERSVLLPGAQVGAGAVIRDCMLGQNSVVGANVILTNLCVVGDEQRVADGTSLETTKIPG